MRPRLDHITIMLSSLERCMPFYEHLLPQLGFQEAQEQVWTDGEGFFLQFREARAGTHPYERFGAGMNHLGFSVTTPEQVHAIREAMQRAGFEVPDIQYLDGATALFLKDADGIRFEVTWYPPGADPVT